MAVETKTIEMGIEIANRTLDELMNAQFNMGRATGYLEGFGEGVRKGIWKGGRAAIVGGLIGVFLGHKIGEWIDKRLEENDEPMKVLDFGDLGGVTISKKED